MSRSVFVSHAVADAPLVAAFVRFLEEGIGLPEEEIFCVSIPGMGIPTGVQFVNYIRDEMETPKIVIMLMTPNYLASGFCQGEMGAAWVKGLRIYPIIVEPATFADIKDVFLGVQAVRMDDKVRINELKEALVKEIGFKPKSAARWDVARNAFYDQLPGLIAALRRPAIVSLQAHEELQAKYDEALQDIADQDEQIRDLKDMVAALKAAKDATAVAAITAQFGSSSAGEEIEALFKKIQATLVPLGPQVIRMHLLAKHYRKPFEGWEEDRAPFDEAERRNIINDEYELNRNSPRVKAALAALEELDMFIHQRADELEVYAEQNSKSGLEADNEDFWREHLL